MEYKFTQEEFMDYLRKNLDGTTQIGLHSLRIDKKVIDSFKGMELDDLKNKESVTKDDIAASVFQNGLLVNEESALLTMFGMGSLSSLDQEQFLNYNYWSYDPEYVDGLVDEDPYNLIIAIPPLFPYKKEQYFVGLLQDSESYEHNNILTNYLLKNVVPSEFIFGYYKKDDDGNVIFSINQNYISYKSEDEQEIFYTRLIQKVGSLVFKVADNDSYSKSPEVTRILEQTIKQKNMFFDVNDNNNDKKKSSKS